MVIESRNDRKVVVTGVGVVAPCGTGADAFWAGLATPPESAVVRRVTGFDSSQWGLSRVEPRRLDRFAQFGIAAAAQALVDACLLPEVTATGSLVGLDPDRVGTLIGSGMGGALMWEEQGARRRERGDRRVSPLTVPMVMPNAAAAAVSMRWDLRGPCETVSAACATGTYAIAGAARWIAAGRADVVLAGGAEAALTETNIAAYTNLRALSSPDLAPVRHRTGRLLPWRGRGGAGAGGGRTPAGAGSTGLRADRRHWVEADAFHLTAPAPGGRGATACMRAALADAQLSPADVTYVNAHGTSTVLNDATEGAGGGDLPLVWLRRTQRRARVRARLVVTVPGGQ